jgi:hypothetical protein
MEHQEPSGHGDWLLPGTYELNPAQIARAIASRISHYCAGHPVAQRVKERIAFLEAKEAGAEGDPGQGQSGNRPHPVFCSGCPHNTSTKVPEGSRALAGIGCHYMVLWMDRETSTFTQMGAEGTTWIGQAPFTDDQARVRQPRRRHLFPLGPAGDPRGGRGQGQHHLQDPVQRRGRDDRRPAHDGPLDPAMIAPAGGRRRAPSSWSPTSRKNTRRAPWRRA